MRYELADYEWIAIKPMLPNKPRGVPRVNDLVSSMASSGSCALNRSFHNYADYTMSGGFRSGLARLRDLGRVRRCAVMSAEAVWWWCHRRIIADYLVIGGEQVFHILGPGQVAISSLTQGPAWAERNGDLSAASGGNGSLNETGSRLIREKL